MLLGNIDTDAFETGDMLLFKYRSFISRFIEYFTSSSYSHCGIIIKNPDFGSFKDEGLYILESTGLEKIPDVEENKVKFGVQLRKLEDVLNEHNSPVYYRKLQCTRNKEFYQKLSHAHAIVHDKPYDDNPLHWVRAKYKLEIGNLQNEDTFFCSALVSFVYMTLGLLPLDTKWSTIEPCQLGTEDGKDVLKFINCKMEREIVIEG